MHIITLGRKKTNSLGSSIFRSIKRSEIEFLGTAILHDFGSLPMAKLYNNRL